MQLASYNEILNVIRILTTNNINNINNSKLNFLDIEKDDPPEKIKERAREYLAFLLSELVSKL